MKAFLAAALCLAAPAYAQAPPSLAEFGDAIHHWQNTHGSDYPRYRGDQVREIADNILLLQRSNGGWIENRDPARILGPDDLASLVKERGETRASFDNRNIYSHVAYLLEAHARLTDAKYRDAAVRGLDFILSRQLTPCGGWPHTTPKINAYHDKLTIADEVTSGNLRLLRRIAKGQGAYAAVDAKHRTQATAALKRGEACVLQLQIRQNGVPTGWAGQYDPVTLAPAQGRSFELPSIVSQETVEMLRYLMEIERPSLEVIAAVDAGVAWLARSQIKGMRLEQVKLPVPVKYPYHTADYDSRLVADPAAPPLWARFYDLTDNSIVLANRDGKRAQHYDQIDPERRTGYAWYGSWATSLLTREYPRWKAAIRAAP